MKQYYNVLDYGAVANAPGLQTEKLQAAIDACFRDGGGEVIVPLGTFRTATLRIRSNVRLHLLSGAVIEGSTDPADYTHFLEDKLEPIDTPDSFLKSPWYNSLIRAYDAHHFAIIGDPGSYLDGKNLYNPEGEEKYRGPHAIHFYKCSDFELCGYTIRDSANWAHCIKNSRNIFAHDLTVFGGHDGFHIQTCDNVVLEDSEFFTGDDCLAGYNNQNVIARNCLFDGACSAMRFGGTDILIDNCRTHAPSRYGFRGSLSPEEKAASAPTNEKHRHTQHTPFLYFCCEGTEIRKTPGNIVVQNCTFDSPNSFFRLWFDGKHRWCANRSLADITFRNCKCIGVFMPIDLFCPENERVTMRLENVEISARKGFEDVPFMKAVNVGELYFDNVTAPFFTAPTILTTDEKIKATFRNSDTFKIEKVDHLEINEVIPKLN